MPQFHSADYANNGGAGALTKAFTTPSMSGRILIVGVGTIINTPVTSVTYAGEALTLLDFHETGSSSTDRHLYLYYIANPAIGANNLVVGSIGGGIWVAIACYVGVDVLNPFGTYAEGTVDNGTLLTVDVSSQSDWVVVDVAWFKGQSAPEPYAGAGQTERVDASVAAIGLSEEQGAGTITMSWTMDQEDAVSIAVPLLPARIIRGRAVSYFFDVWDPQQRILDAAGAPVDPWNVKPDAWLMVAGWGLPTAVAYENFNEDPRLAYIESVSYDDASGQVEITTNRGELSEVILARSSQGSNT